MSYHRYISHLIPLNLNLKIFASNYKYERSILVLPSIGKPLPFRITLPHFTADISDDYLQKFETPCRAYDSILYVSQLSVPLRLSSVLLHAIQEGRELDSFVESTETKRAAMGDTQEGRVSEQETENRGRLWRVDIRLSVLVEKLYNKNFLGVAQNGSRNSSLCHGFPWHSSTDCI